MAETLDWLLEEDDAQPGVRYFALVDLLKRPAQDAEAVAARRAVMERGPVPAVLAAQDKDGYWCTPGSGYLPKYRSTVWSVIYLAQLGADPADARVRAGAEHLLAHLQARSGAFSLDGRPSTTIHCLAGNAGRALLDLGMGDDERLMRGLEVMARYVTGEGIAPAEEKGETLRWYASAMCGPGLRCSANDRLPCGWGAVKVLRALARVPAERRTPPMERALQATVDFLFSVDPATAGYPSGFTGKPSSSWFRFGFPVFYVTDVLQVAEALGEAGWGRDPRLAALRELILAKRDATGRWKMEYTYEGKTWADVEAKGRPGKWVTLRAERALAAMQGAA